MPDPSPERAARARGWTSFAIAAAAIAAPAWLCTQLGLDAHDGRGRAPVPALA